MSRSNNYQALLDDIRIYRDTIAKGSGGVDDMAVWLLDRADAREAEDTQP